MYKYDLKCVLIGRKVDEYIDLARLVRKIDPTSRFKQVDLNENSVTNALKQISGPSLIFISDEVSFSLETLSDLTWQYNSDSIVVIVTKKAESVSIKELFNNTQFSRINLNDDSQADSILQFLIQSAREKADFRQCKHLLGISEKRCQWLVDSSREAIAYVSRDIHLHANSAYLKLFDIATIQEIRAITIKDIIVPDEHLLFDSFLKHQDKSSDRRRSIMLSMKKSNKSTFRANVYLIPTVFKGNKCYQLWIREINSLENSETERLQTTEGDPILEKIKSAKMKSNDFQVDNPFNNVSSETLEKSKAPKSNLHIQNLQTSEVVKAPVTLETPIFKKQSYDQNSLLKGVIRRKEARIVVTSLHDLKKNDSDNKDDLKLKHRMVSLKVAAAQKKGVDDLLTKLPDSLNDPGNTIFWDKVKLSRVLQIIIPQEKLPMTLLLRISEASVLDESFIQWLTPGLKRLGERSKHMIFLIPTNIEKDQYKQVISFVKKLKKLECRVALDSFSMNQQSLVLLKYTKPDYVRLSLPWTRQLQGDESKEIRLSSVIRQLEAKTISVIAPCGFSKDMKKLFILSGASFCQERTIKKA